MSWRLRAAAASPPAGRRRRPLAWRCPRVEDVVQVPSRRRGTPPPRPPPCFPGPRGPALPGGSPAPAGSPASSRPASPASQNGVSPAGMVPSLGAGPSAGKKKSLLSSHRLCHCHGKAIFGFPVDLDPDPRQHVSKKKKKNWFR